MGLKNGNKLRVGICVEGKVINLRWHPELWREDYRYGLYYHRLISKDGITYTRPLIVIRNQFDVIVRFTNLHNYVGIYENKVFVPIMSDAAAKLHYVCMMLNYVLIKNYSGFRIDHVFNINKVTLECFFRDYATGKMSDGKYRGEQSIEKCVYTVTAFFQKLRRKFGSYITLTENDLYTEKKVYNRYGKFQKTKWLPAFQVKGIPRTEKVFRELPTKAFRILLNLAFRYAPEIAFAMCLQAFAGLRAGEVCNVRQEGSPVGKGLLFTRVEGRTIKVEIDLTREMPMRSDGVICGRIKKERTQCVYPPFLEAFVTAYEHHQRFLSNCAFEADYRPMFIDVNGMAMTYKTYSRHFAKLIDNHFRPTLLECDDPECRIYGQLLYENRLTLHSLRHWYSTQLVLHGEDIAQIQFWRGDKNPESAFVYLQDKGDLVKELEEANNFFAEILMEQGEMEFNNRYE